MFGTAARDFPASWYFGLDGNPTGADPDFVTTVLHELAHGLGFSTLINLQTGGRLMDVNDVYILHLRDDQTGKQFPEMTNEERSCCQYGGKRLAVGRSQRGCSERTLDEWG